MATDDTNQIIDPARRDFLRKSFAGMGWVMAGTTLSQCTSEGDAAPTMSNIQDRRSCSPKPCCWKAANAEVTAASGSLP